MPEYKTIGELLSAADREYERTARFLKETRQFVKNLENELLISEAESAANR
ncbi:MAG: hypothetical protein V1886_04005 [archaeon]